MILRREETEAVYMTLVGEMAHTITPVSTMIAVMIGIAIDACGRELPGHVAVMAIIPAIMGAVKVGAILLHRRHVAAGQMSLGDARAIELAYALISWATAATIGAWGVVGFSIDDPIEHWAVTACIFGYCAGAINRLAFRPVIALGAVLLSTLPIFVAASVQNSDNRVLVAFIGFAFFGIAVKSIGDLHDATTRHIKARLQMEHIARRDPLTLLLNRLGLREAFALIPRCSCQTIALHAFDLDGFKAINDTYGHAAGDRLLVEIAQRLRRLEDDTIIVARVGGDEFVVIQAGLARSANPSTLAREIHATLMPPYDLGDGSACRIGVSLGYTTADAEHADLESLLRTADHAAYRAKREGGGAVRYRPSAALFTACAANSNS